MDGADLRFYLNMVNADGTPAHNVVGTEMDLLVLPVKKEYIISPRKQAKLFKRIFSEAPPSNIKWSELENAMRAIGFKIVPIAGTAIRFEPPVDRERPVVLYRPHPGKEIEPQKVKEIARVLQRRYGWSVDMFLKA
ncbi:hypothetical protein CALVIDRAFT_273823 [Calocera viscosa TUFC12733]|uniref:Type II toxin-antitoxin system HicA family toxin n=1 Tax=Calocera viscosa (strain TUFC12733) TaxID=1330018 RepID=A0A167QYS6_CALVF|nr:hypothetical protein CALVIDRAFT_273823 [Calocera viscosa TUFC12733]